MGIFDSIFGKKSHVEFGKKSNVESLDDMIWLSREGKFAGVAKAAHECFSSDEPPVACVLVDHFPDCLAELETLGPFEGPVTTTLAAALSNLRAVEPGLGEDDIINIIVAERHPLPQHDEAVLEFARSLPCRSRVRFHLSLDDPVMKEFGELIENNLKRLGMKEHEAIESKVVGRRIKAEQRKIAKQAVSDLRANSAEEWLELNCRHS